jgi:hypothetical protein
MYVHTHVAGGRAQCGGIAPIKRQGLNWIWTHYRSMLLRDSFSVDTTQLDAVTGVRLLEKLGTYSTFYERREAVLNWGE